jgi:hypothetical protein
VFLLPRQCIERNRFMLQAQSSQAPTMSAKTSISLQDLRFERRPTGLGVSTPSPACLGDSHPLLVMARPRSTRAGIRVPTRSRSGDPTELKGHGNTSFKAATTLLCHGPMLLFSHEREFLYASALLEQQLLRTTPLNPRNGPPGKFLKLLCSPPKIGSQLQ